MTDPIRWSEAEPSVSPIEQTLVRAGQEVLMPSDEKRAIWQGILNGVAAMPMLPDVPGPASSVTKVAVNGGRVSLLALKGAKVLLVTATLAGLTVGGYHWLGKPRSSREVVPAMASILPSVSPSVSLAPAVPPQLPPESAHSEAAASVATAATGSVQNQQASRASQLKEESLAVMAARQALRSNDAGKALHLLEQAQLRFKRGGLAEEREALTIEALAKLGQTSRASARARAFLTQYPRSPHAADVQQFAK